MSTTAKFEVVPRSNLRKGDKVRIVNLEDASVSGDVTVTYVSVYGGVEFNTAMGSARSLSSGDTNNRLFLRQAKPANWPPKRDDVWSIGGYLWHMMATGFRRASSSTVTSPEDVLASYGAGKAELKFRNS